MKKKILHHTSIMIIFAVLVTFLAASVVTYNKLNTYMQRGVREEAQYICLAMDEYGDSFLTKKLQTVSSSRVTLIRKDGTVLYDSETSPKKLANHSDRPEFIQAEKNGKSESIRYSETFAKKTFYYAVKLDDEQEEDSSLHRVEAVLGPRFPGINKKLGEFNFKRHYGAAVKEIKRSGQSITENLDNEVLRDGDTLVVMADDSFVQTWGESSVFVLLANGKDNEPVPGKGKRWFALVLLILMIAGATVGELPVVKEAFPDIKLDMFFFVSVTTIIMAWTKIFPARKYTKYISWDILITIACAFAISKAMVNSGVADVVASYIIGLTEHYGPQVLLAAVFIITNLFTELITNNAAAALAFPLALSISSQMGVSPMPFFVVICMAASASFSTPIGYQTNLIVQGIGNYKFTDFVRIGLPLNIITFLISIILIPLIWNF